MAVLKIREAFPAKGGDAAEVAGVVCLNDGPEYAIKIRNLFSIEKEERLEWYFEEHLTPPFPRGVKARGAAQSITRYGEALFNQVFANRSVYALYVRAHDLPRAFALDALLVRRRRIAQALPAQIKPAPALRLPIVTDQKRSGFYHLVHFDTHRALLSYDQMNAVGSSGQRHMFRRYGRGQLAPYAGQRAFLFLENESWNDVDPVEAADLASMLSGHISDVVT